MRAILPCRHSVPHTQEGGELVFVVELTDCVCSRVCVGTQVHIGGLRSLRVRRALVHSIQQLLLHLRHRVAVQRLHRHFGGILVLRVDAVQRLHKQRSEVNHHICTGKSAGQER